MVAARTKPPGLPVAAVRWDTPFFLAIQPARTALHEQMPAKDFLEMEEVAAKITLVEEPSGPELPDPLLTSAYELHADEHQLLGAVLPDGVDLAKVSLTEQQLHVIRSHQVMAARQAAEEARLVDGSASAPVSDPQLS